MANTASLLNFRKAKALLELKFARKMHAQKEGDLAEHFQPSFVVYSISQVLETLLVRVDEKSLPLRNLVSDITTYYYAYGSGKGKLKIPLRSVRNSGYWHEFVK